MPCSLDKLDRTVNSLDIWDLMVSILMVQSRDQSQMLDSGDKILKIPKSKDFAYISVNINQ